MCILLFFFFFQAEDGIRDGTVTGVQTCALPISAFFPELRGKLIGAGPGDGDHPVQFGLQMARRLHGDGYAVRQRVLQLVGTEALRRSRGEQEPDDVLQVAVLTSQAEGSKRRSGLAAQLGSLTPWRTAVISARIATAISGGVFEPM